MFSGLVEIVGTVSNVSNSELGKHITIAVPSTINDLKIGDSLCVDGVCLTCEKKTDNNNFVLFAGAETLRRSTLNKITSGNKVNLERSLMVGDRIGGHFVAGHVDCVGEIVSQNNNGGTIELCIEIEDSTSVSQIAEKGSITIDGISLTVFKTELNKFYVSVIPHTYKNTTLYLKPVGSKVNVETDILAKYITSALNSSNSRKNEITLESLRSMGY